MKQLYVSNQPPAAAELFAQDRFAEDMDVTRETLWRWRRDGLLRTINIRGRIYVTAEEAADFKRRALAGQFAKPARRPSRTIHAVRPPAAKAPGSSVEAGNQQLEVGNEKE